MVTDVTDLEAGTIIRKGDTEYQLVDDPDFGTVSTEIGDRELTAEQVPDVGDDCVRTQCDGHVTDVNGKRWCSEGYLEWMRTTPQDGDPCDRYGDRCDGTLQAVGDLEWECDTCSRRRVSSRVTWRESWLQEFMRTRTVVLMTDSSGNATVGTDQTCLQPTLTNSITNPIRLIAAIATITTKTAVLPVRKLSISTNPLIHPIRSPIDSAAAIVSTKSRCQLPFICRPFCVRVKRGLPEIAPFLPIYRGYLESAKRSLRTDADHLGGDP